MDEEERYLRKRERGQPQDYSEQWRGFSERYIASYTGSLAGLYQRSDGTFEWGSDTAAGTDANETALSKQNRYHDK